MEAPPPPPSLAAPAGNGGAAAAAAPPVAPSAPLAQAPAGAAEVSGGGVVYYDERAQRSGFEHALLAFWRSRGHATVPPCTMSWLRLAMLPWDLWERVQVRRAPRRMQRHTAGPCVAEPRAPQTEARADATFLRISAPALRRIRRGDQPQAVAHHRQLLRTARHAACPACTAFVHPACAVAAVRRMHRARRPRISAVYASGCAPSARVSGAGRAMLRHNAFVLPD
jgi:hypothetical protein